MTCHTARTDGAPTYCDNTGNLPACQLCPNSPNYWQLTYPPPAADPYDSTPKRPVPALDMTGWIDDRTPHDPRNHTDLTRLRCILCNIPTTWISPKGTRCHPSCATLYLRHREQTRRTTPPVSATDPT